MFTQKVYLNIPLSSRDRAIFTFSEFGTRQRLDRCINVILQFLGLDLFNIILSAKFYQTIPNGLIVNFHFFSEFEPRQNLDQSQMSFDNRMGYILSMYQCVCLCQISFDNLIGYILSISMCMQSFITIFFTVLEIGPFSLFQNLELGKT